MSSLNDFNSPETPAFIHLYVLSFSSNLSPFSNHLTSHFPYKSKIFISLLCEIESINLNKFISPSSECNGIVL